MNEKLVYVFVLLFYSNSTGEFVKEDVGEKWKRKSDTNHWDVNAGRKSRHLFLGKIHVGVNLHQRVGIGGPEEDTWVPGDLL